MPNALGLLEVSLSEDLREAGVSLWASSKYGVSHAKYIQLDTKIRFYGQIDSQYNMDWEKKTATYKMGRSAENKNYELKTPKVGLDGCHFPFNERPFNDF